jgi:hypothetical protein
VSSLIRALCGGIICFHLDLTHLRPSASSADGFSP